MGKPKRGKLGLALAGGGPQGAVYEIGALRALDEAVEGLDLNGLDVYVGVSAGAFVAACLTNGLTSAQLCRAVVTHGAAEQLFAPATFFTPAFSRWLRAGSRAPRLLYEAMRDVLLHPEEQSVTGALTRLTEALPVGVFRNEPLRAFLEEVFTREGRTDDFRKLASELIVVAADLDSGEAVRFGEPGLDDVPISTAVVASSALPGLYPPVEIGGRHFVDGVLLKTLHGSVALDRGVDLLICVNPIAPVDTADAVARGVMRRGKLVDRGLPIVLSQTFRTLIHSRLEAGFARYGDGYPEQDIVFVEPPRDDYKMFFTNAFSLKGRWIVLEHAYRATMRRLHAKRERYGPMFERRGMRLLDHVIDDAEREVWDTLGFRPGSPRAQVTRRLDDALDRVTRLVESS